MTDIATETFTTPGTYTRVAATNGTLDVIECWGSGSGGFDDTSGGGGGAYSKKLSYAVTAGTSFDVVVPSGGGPNAYGADAIFKITSSTEICKAKGGNGGAGGAAASGIGDTKYSGGSSAYGGGGGSSAGTGANGNNGSGDTGGSAPTGGGAGGNGDNTGSSPGADGGAPGGGGGAGWYGQGSGSGGAGKVKITWTPSGGGGGTEYTVTVSDSIPLSETMAQVARLRDRTMSETAIVNDFLTSVMAAPLDVDLTGRHFVNKPSNSRKFLLLDFASKIWKSWSDGGVLTYLDNAKSFGYDGMFLSLGSVSSYANRDGVTPVSGGGAGLWVSTADARLEDSFMRPIDFIVSEAEKRNFLVFGAVNGFDSAALFWQKVDPTKPEIAQAFGEWIGSRYGGFTNMNYATLGELPSAPTSAQLAAVRRFATGIKNSTNRKVMISVEPRGPGSSSSYFLGNDLVSAGQWMTYWGEQSYDIEASAAALTTSDYARTPAMPVLDLETITWGGNTSSSDLTHQHYVTYMITHVAMQGGAGVTVGLNEIQNGDVSATAFANMTTTSWRKSPYYLKQLMESRPGVVVGNDNLIPNSRGTYQTEVVSGYYGMLRGCTGYDARWGMVYYPGGQNSARPINLNQLTGVPGTVRRWWYDLSSGACVTDSGTITTSYAGYGITKVSSMGLTKPTSGGDFVSIFEADDAPWGVPGVPGGVVYSMTLQDAAALSDGASTASERISAIFDAFDSSDLLLRVALAYRILADTFDLSDSLSVLYTPAGGAVYNVTLSDGLTMTDGPLAAAEMSRVVGESFSISESTLSSVVAYRLLSEQLDIVEELRATVERFYRLSDGLTMDESLAAATERVRVLSDSTDLFDALYAYLNEGVFNGTVYNVTLQDFMNMSERHPPAFIEYDRRPQDALTLTDIVERYAFADRLLSDSFDMTDALAANITGIVIRILQDAIEMADGTAALAQFTRLLPQDQFLMSDISASIRELYRAMVEPALTVYDSTIVQVMYQRVLQDQIADLIDAVLKQQKLDRRLMDSIELRDALASSIPTLLGAVVSGIALALRESVTVRADIRDSGVVGNLKITGE